MQLAKVTTTFAYYFFSFQGFYFSAGSFGCEKTSPSTH